VLPYLPYYQKVSFEYNIVASSVPLVQQYISFLGHVAGCYFWCTPVDVCLLMNQLVHILQCFPVMSFVLFSTVYWLPLQLEMGSLNTVFNA